MTGSLFPLWQVDRAEYESVCAYLGLVPSSSIFTRLNAYLLDGPSRFAAPQGFSRFLAEPRLTRFRVARLDLATRLLDRGHPARHTLNAVIALHECDAVGYAQMSASPTGARLLPSLVAWCFGFGLSAAITLPWLAYQFVRYLPKAIGSLPADLEGKRVLVIGSARGLGLDLALDCLERGANVVATVRSESSRTQLQALLPNSARVRLLVSDLSHPGALAATLAKAEVDPDSLALAILCAGVKHDSTSVLSMAELRETFEVNLFAAANLARWLCKPDAGLAAPSATAPAAAPDAALSTTRPSTSPTTSLVLVSSMGRWHGMHSSAGYNASKAALSIWGESLEMELRRNGTHRVAVTIVEPGLFESGMTARTGIKRLLSVPRRTLASGIIEGALAGRRVLRPPFWFALLTWCLCLAGPGWRLRLLGRAKKLHREDS